MVKDPLPLTEVGGKMFQFCKVNGIKIKDFAKLVDTSYSNLHAVVTGKRKSACLEQKIIEAINSHVVEKRVRRVYYL